VNPDTSNPKKDLLLNLLTVVILTCALVIAAVVAVIFINPASPLNPLRPPELPALASLPTSLPEASESPVGASEAPESAPETAAPSDTHGLVVITPTPPGPNSISPTESRPESASFDFVVLEAPLALPASEYDSSRGCDWMGVAGQVFDIQGAPVRGLRVAVRATLEGNRIEMIGMSGTAELYGPSGYEIRLADRPIASSGQAEIQLIDQAGLPLSEAFLFDTSDSCDENLILIDFQEIR
jgi:hypothetical protein